MLGNWYGIFMVRSMRLRLGDRGVTRDLISLSESLAPLPAGYMRSTSARLATAGDTGRASASCGLSRLLRPKALGIEH